jgi:hypothetical protein
VDAAPGSSRGPGVCCSGPFQRPLS